MQPVAFANSHRNLIQATVSTPPVASPDVFTIEQTEQIHGRLGNTETMSAPR